MMPISSANTNSPTKRKRARRRFYGQGVTLAELIVASFVMTIVLFASYDVLVQGYSYFRSNEAALDAQRDSLTMLTELQTELENTNLNLVYLGDPIGVSFASPLDQAGIMVVDQNGALYYQDWIGYYLGTDHCIYRKNSWMAVENSTINAGTSGGLQAALNGFTPSGYFAIQTLPGTKQLARNIDQWYVQAGTVLGGSSGTASASTVNVTLYAGDPNTANTEGYYVKVRSAISPRNFGN